MSETQPLLRIPDRAYGPGGVPVLQGDVLLHQPEQGPVNGPLPLEAKDLGKHALVPDTPENFIHGPINIFPGEVAARRVAAAVGGALRLFPQAVLDSASVTLFGAPSAVDVNDPRLGRAVTTGAAAFALAACAPGVAQPPTRQIEVTRAATAIVMPPTLTSTVEATRTAIPPTATREATRTPSPSATPDSSIKSVKLEANLTMAQELTKTTAGQVLLARVDDLANNIGSTRANVLANLDVSYSIDPATKETKYAFANVKAGGGFGALTQTQGLDTGAFVAGDLVFRSKQTDLQNNQYPEIDVDGKLLVVSTGRASIVAGVKVDIVRPDVYKRKFVAFGADGSVVAEASMDINSSPIKNSKGEPLPDWKAVWTFLPAPTAVAGITVTPGSSGGPEPTTQALAEKTPTPAATQAAETVKPTGAYKEVNGSIVWTSFENARDTITPPVIPGLKTQLKGETVVYVDAAGKEVGQFNPEVTLTDGTTKRIGGISLNSDEIDKLLQKPENANKIAFPVDIGSVKELRQAATDDGKSFGTLIELQRSIKLNELFGPMHSKALIGNGPLATQVSYDTTLRSYRLALTLGLPQSAQKAFHLLDTATEERYTKALNDFLSHTLKGHPAYTKIDSQLGKYHAILYFNDLTDKANIKNSLNEYLQQGSSLISQK